MTFHRTRTTKLTTREVVAIVDEHVRAANDGLFTFDEARKLMVDEIKLVIRHMGYSDPMMVEHCIRLWNLRKDAFKV